MAQGDQDKTEQPTPYRLEEARRKGEVAKSADIVGVAGLLVFVLVLMLTVAGIAHALSDATRRVVELAGARPLLGMEMTGWLGQVYGGLMQSLMPLVLALVVVAVVSNLAQTGPIFSAHPIRPDFQRMNPANAFKRVFSMRSLWELGKLTVKLALLVMLGYLAFAAAPQLVGLVASASPRQLPELLLDGFWKTSLYVLLVLGLAALADLLFVRRDHMKRMRMSRRELRDEVKRRDGDPEVKSKQKRQQRELLKKVRALPRVGDADVVLTNPTHYAVAVQYRPRTMRAPVVLAKGRGFLAARIRALAGTANVPVLRMPALARALYADCEIDGPVPEGLYGQLAPVYRQLFAQGRASR
ncbi:EscU/YscU/HrcU family type III secretion system export apparatus switch protein [Pseudoxanthomonas sp. PXM02]|uniref:EscU/YscU/HrcU family type III secretion system export apparatus switch protein n=1 Tax=Pseudoxanthomonas sp. PXM02 TaxID=2769294 RepID=UPI001786363C|nr:EscU/YscU/HrcU family type III secretion system export apparatus switch protein [Pseudoxanthomonas sp. PXM02]MBD9477432.1 EscU/YscU/HrcU family type III secretion system export apparatus switch protein [Pseudoxanthomonas sp. PXM02]